MKTVFTNGIFDLLHRGHLDFLTKARELGDRLVVAVDSDASARSLKPGRPIAGEEERLELVRALRCVDEAFLTDSPLASLANRFAPGDLYAKGDERHVYGSPEVRAAESAGALVVLVRHERRISTTRRIAQIRGEAPDLDARIVAFAQRIIGAHRCGSTIHVAGNGGSAAEASHFVAELVGRFKEEREPLRAVNLAGDMATVTAIANDYGFEEVFARQIRAARSRDVLILLSTSGKSSNVLRAAEVGNALGLHVLALTRFGSPLASLADLAIASTSSTARMQEEHLAQIHQICAAVDGMLA